MLIVAVGAIAYVVTDRARPFPDAHLDAAIDALRERHPRHFQFFRALGRAELDAVPRRRDRVPDDLRILAPCGRAAGSFDVLLLAPKSSSEIAVVINDSRGNPAVRWSQRVDGDARATAGPDGLLVRTGWPSVLLPLASGHYTIEASATHEGGEATGASSLEVVFPGELGAYRSAADIVVKEAPADIRSLILAHLAWRKGFLGDALLHALDAVTEAPDYPLENVTFDALDRLGS